MDGYEIVIGLEVHVELKTDSKMFCGCSTKFGAPPNSQVCPVCLGMPGVLPVINKRAVELAVRTACAFEAGVLPVCRFARKNYFYPDLPKNYQISQYEEPVAAGGFVDTGIKRIGLTRVHLEEDAGKLVHSETGGHFSYVDFNRSGIPLMEIVSEPDIRSPEEAENYLLALKRDLEYIGVSDCNMEEGSLRCDANISLRPEGTTALGVKTEIKNMNSFKAVRKALAFEAHRHLDLLREGAAVRQETRLWNEALSITESMRGKEEAHDYRYFPDPDLVPLHFDGPWIAAIREGMTELAGPRRARFETQYELSAYDAGVLTARKETADYYEDCVRLTGNPKITANWVMGDLAALANENKIGLAGCPVTPDGLAELVNLILDGTITTSAAKEILRESFVSGRRPAAVMKEKNLGQIQDDGLLLSVVQQVVADNPKAIEDLRSGKQQAAGFLLGQIMRGTKGKANPQKARELLIKEMEHGQ